METDARQHVQALLRPHIGASRNEDGQLIVLPGQVVADFGASDDNLSLERASRFSEADPTNDQNRLRADL